MIFFLVVKPVNALLARNKADDERAPESPTPDVMLLTEIRDLLRDGERPRADPPSSAPAAWLGPALAHGDVSLHAQRAAWPGFRQMNR